MSSQRICIIIAYFGKLPNTIGLWLESCKYNPTIDFLVYSDCAYEGIPQNVKWIKNTFESFRELVYSKLKMQVKLDTPYECCDLKAVYGKIFEDYLKDYDYWGYCDMDMVFGDLRWFFDKYNLSMYDRFLPFGHLSLMRNTKENNERYRLPCTPGKGYAWAFQQPGSTHFCEEEINHIYTSYGFPFFKDRICADICVAFNRMRVAGYFPDYKEQVFYWQKGKVWRAYKDRYVVTKRSVIELEEFAYIHFQKRKMNNPEFALDDFSGFYITSNSFVKKESLATPTIKEINQLNPYHPIKEWIEFASYKILRRINYLKKKH